MSKGERIELLAHLIETVISNLGYPVGMGIAPHPETVKRLAADCLKVATYEKAAS